MAEDHDAEGTHDGPASGAARRGRRRREQLEFEIEFLGRVLESDPLYVDALRVHADNLARAGQYTRALQVDRRLVRLLPDRPIPWYNLACSYAVLGMIEPAFFALQRAMELGYPNLRRLLRDPDLKSLRRDPRFSRILRLTKAES